MDLQTIGIEFARIRKAIKSINSDIIDLQKRLTDIEARYRRTIEEVVCSPGQHEYSAGKHPMTDSIFKSEDEVYGPRKKRSYE